MINLMAQRIRVRRKQQGLTQQELAQKAGYTSKAMIARIESGLVDLPQSKVIAIADALNVDPSYLIGYDDDSVAKMEVIDSQIQRLYDSLPEDKKKQAMDFLWYLKQGSVGRP